jgi:signal peptidase II
VTSPVGRATAPGGRRPPRAVVLAVAAVVVGVDQVSKTWAEDHLSQFSPRHLVGSLSLQLVENPGAAFGLGRGVTPVVEAVVVVLVVALAFFGRTASRRASGPALVGIGLLLGGAIGNLIDRVVRDNGGAVIDFVDIARIGGHNWWPTFNLADASIVIGAILVVLSWSRRDDTASTVDRSPVQADV